MNIPITRPLVGNEEIDEISNVIHSEWLTQGEAVKIFEEKKLI